MLFSYKSDGQSNMALMQIDALSGHQFDGEELEKLTDLEDFQKVDLDKGDTTANIYLNKVLNITVTLAFDGDPIKGSVQSVVCASLHVVVPMT